MGVVWRWEEVEVDAGVGKKQRGESKEGKYPVGCDSVIIGSFISSGELLVTPLPSEDM
jgi:hypothetical protein